MNLLITGGSGFIGSNFICRILKNNEDIHLINIDKLTYASNLDNLADISNHPRYTFVEGDICNRKLVDNLFKKHQIDGVIHFAAESHVDNSIENPSSFMESNIIGTFTLLEAARNFWMDGINTYKSEYKFARFHHISTDEVYGSLDTEGYFTEKSHYAPNSPYSASKAASDMIVRSYFHTYGMNVVTTNCSNNYGPRQHAEKLIPTIIRKALALETIPIYGDGKNIRDWLYVEDHCTAIEKIFKEGKAGETYLIGGHNERTNLEIAEIICETLDRKQPISSNSKGLTSYKQLIEFVQDRPGHDFRYAIDDTKLRKELGFQPEYTFEMGIANTIAYYLNNLSISNTLKGR